MIKHFCRSKSTVKTMLLTSFYIRGIVHYEFVPTGETVNKVYYLEVLERLREKVRWKDPKFLPTTHGSCITTMHLPTRHYLREFLATKQITMLAHPAYSPDLAPKDFFFVPEDKEILKGRHFDDIVDIRINTMAALTAIPQNQFQNCFEGCTRRWYRCLTSQGE